MFYISQIALDVAETNAFTSRSNDLIKNPQISDNHRWQLRLLAEKADKNNFVSERMWAQVKKIEKSLVPPSVNKIKTSPLIEKQVTEAAKHPSILGDLCTRIANFIFAIFRFLFCCGKSAEKPPVASQTTSLQTQQPAKTSPIIEFYRNGARNDKNVTLEEIWQKDKNWLEDSHDYIQWLFPTRELSGPNPTAPTTNDQIMVEFRKDEKLKQKMLHSFEVMLDFFGLKLNGKVVEETPSFNQAAQNWLIDKKHNHLRISRMLTSMRLHGLEPQAQAFFDKLTKIYGTKLGQKEISKTTFNCWTNAAKTPQALDLASIIKSTPSFNKYGFKADPNVHLTDLDKRPNNLFYEALFGNKFKITQPGEDPFIKFDRPLSEVRKFIFALPDSAVISVCAKGKKANLYSAKQYIGKVDLTNYLGNATYQISAKEIKEMLNSQRVYVSALIPKAFYLGLKDALAKDNVEEIPGHDNAPLLVSDLAKCCPNVGAYLKKVQDKPGKYGFDVGFTFSFDQVLSLSVYQLGAMVIKTEDYHSLLNQDYAIADRKVGQKDAIMLISASGIRGFLNSGQLPGNEHHQIDRVIMKHTFQTTLKAAGKDAFVILPALGMGVWGGDPQVYWRAFLDAVLESGADLQNILVNPGHQPTPSVGCKGEEFAKILKEYKQANPGNANLNKIINLYSNQSDLLVLAQNIKKTYPDRTVAIVNASDPEVTLGVVGPGEYANDICHASTTEENFAVAGATLGFEGITGVLSDKNRVLKGE